MPPIKLRACQRIGEISRDLETIERARTDLHPTDGKQTKTEQLAQAGISTSTANRYEALAGPRIEQAPKGSSDKARVGLPRLAMVLRPLSPAFGEYKYGDRKALVESDDWTGPAFGTCVNAAIVCRAFHETPRRRGLLSFRHHTEVASLDPATADVLHRLVRGAAQERSQKG